MKIARRPSQRRPPSNRRRLTNRGRQRGTATVELAVCLPLLTLLVFGSIQACDLIYLKHGIVTAAYEGSLELSRPGVSTSTVTGRINQTLGLRNVSGASVSLEPAGIELADAQPGTPVTIVISAPVSGNVPAITFLPMPTNLSVEFACTR